MSRSTRLGIPKERIAQRIGFDQKTISNYSGEKANLPFLLNSDLKQDFTAPQIAEKHGWPEPLVWAIKLEGKNDIPRYKEIQWGIKTWDYWSWNDYDKRFGDEWPGRNEKKTEGCQDFHHGVFYIILFLPQKSHIGPK